MIHLLTEPSGYIGQPWRYAANQIGHMALGFAWAWSGLPVIAWIGVYAAWEAVQLLRYRATLWDCLEDACFAIGGALGVWPILAGFLAVGVARRIQEQST